MQGIQNLKMTHVSGNFSGKGTQQSAKGNAGQGAQQPDQLKHFQKGGPGCKSCGTDKAGAPGGSQAADKAGGNNGAKVAELLKMIAELMSNKGQSAQGAQGAQGAAAPGGSQAADKAGGAGGAKPSQAADKAGGAGAAGGGVNKLAKLFKALAEILTKGAGKSNAPKQGQQPQQSQAPSQQGGNSAFASAGQGGANSAQPGRRLQVTG